MSVLKRLRDAVERKQNAVFAHHDSIQGMKDHLDEHAGTDPIPPFSAELTVMSTEPFNHGWHCTLTDKNAAGEAYPAMKKGFDELKYREQRKYVLRLTIWRAKENPSRAPKFVEGTTAFFKEVTDLKKYNDELQGSTDMDEVMKQEEDEWKAKKARVSADSKPPAKAPAKMPGKGSTKAPANA